MTGQEYTLVEVNGVVHTVKLLTEGWSSDAYGQSGLVDWNAYLVDTTGKKLFSIGGVNESPDMIPSTVEEFIAMY